MPYKLKLRQGMLDTNEALRYSTLWRRTSYEMRSLHEGRLPLYETPYPLVLRVCRSTLTEGHALLTSIALPISSFSGAFSKRGVHSLSALWLLGEPLWRLEAWLPGLSLRSSRTRALKLPLIDSCCCTSAFSVMVQVRT